MVTGGGGRGWRFLKRNDGYAEARPLFAGGAPSFSEVTFYRWRKEYAGMSGDRLRRLKELEKENERLRRAVSDLTLDKQILKEAAGGKGTEPDSNQLMEHGADREPHDRPGASDHNHQQLVAFAAHERACGRIHPMLPRADRPRQCIHRATSTGSSPGRGRTSTRSLASRPSAGMVSGCPTTATLRVHQHLLFVGFVRGTRAEVRSRNASLPTLPFVSISSGYVLSSA